MLYHYCHGCGDECQEPTENLCLACWVQVQADLAADAKMAFFESEAAAKEAEFAELEAAGFLDFPF